MLNPSAPASIASRGECGPSRRCRRRWRVTVGTALAHDVEPQRRRGAPARRGRCRSGDASSASRYSSKVSQSHGEALVQRGAGDVLDALHQLDELVVVGRPHRGEADAAVAHHHRGHAVPRRRHEPRVPRRLPVVVGVDVDEAGRRRARRRRRSRAPGAVDRADLGDHPVADGDVSGARARRRCRRSSVPPRITRSWVMRPLYHGGDQGRAPSPSCVRSSRSNAATSGPAAAARIASRAPGSRRRARRPTRRRTRRSRCRRRSRASSPRRRSGRSGPGRDSWPYWLVGEWCPNCAA